MNLTSVQKRLCVRVVNVFETGTADGDYAVIAIFADGPHNMKQITYGRSQTTEYGHLRELVALYVQNHGTYANQLAAYIPKISVEPLTGDKVFKTLLIDAAKNDVVMRATQDAFFDKRYWDPTVAWATTNGFTSALAALVLYDSHPQRRHPAVPARPLLRARPVERGRREAMDQRVRRHAGELAQHPLARHPAEHRLPYSVSSPRDHARQLGPRECADLSAREAGIVGSSASVALLAEDDGQALDPVDHA